MEYLGYFGLLSLIVLLVLGVPVTFAMGAIAIIGLALVSGLDAALPQVMMVIMQTGTDFVLLCIPLFVFMGKMVFHTGIARELFTCVESWCGRMHGGLLISSVITCAMFGAVTGSSSASVATMSGILRPELKRYNYNDQLSAGAITSAGTLAILIPPSAGFIFYGVLTDTSVGKLFLAGIVPGVISTFLYCLYCWLVCRIKPELGPIGSKYTWLEKIISLKGTWGILLLFTLVIGSIYAGLCTPTEAAGIGVVGVLAISAVQRKLTWKATSDAMIDTAYVTAMIYGIIFTGYLLARFLAVTGASQALVNFVASIELSQYTFLLIVAIIYLILGTMLDMFGLLILTLPFFFPLVKFYHIDPVWFGVFTVIMAEVGLLSPPVGLNVYVMHAEAPDIPMKTIFKGVVPFMLINMFCVLLLVVFPWLAVWLPSIAIQ